MSFMETPVPVLEENGKMTESQLTIAVAFATELISLGVIDLVPHGVLFMNVCPLFLVAKLGQPDHWICIEDMKKGHQNQSCAADPVHMTCPEDILPWMYPGGFSSVIDASKFFHMFLTLDEERKFMGLINPDTGDHHWYTRLTMGSSNSPALSDRFGASPGHVLVVDLSTDTNVIQSYFSSRAVSIRLFKSAHRIGEEQLPCTMPYRNVSTVLLYCQLGN
jgi:hypothetical protein